MTLSANSAAVVVVAVVVVVVAKVFSVEPNLAWNNHLAWNHITKTTTTKTAEATKSV